MTNADRVRPGLKLVLLAMALAVTVLFGTSFFYRMAHPGMRMQLRQENQPPARGAMPADPQAMGRIQDLMAAMQQNPKNREVLKELAESFMTMRAFDRAEAFAQRMLALNTKDLDALRIQSMVLFDRKDYQAAARVLEKILAITPDDPLAHYNLGIVLKHYLGRPDEAAGHFRFVVRSPKADSGLQEQAAGNLPPTP